MLEIKRPRVAKVGIEVLHSQGNLCSARNILYKGEDVKGILTKSTIFCSFLLKKLQIFQKNSSLQLPAKRFSDGIVFLLPVPRRPPRRPVSAQRPGDKDPMA
ncbi:MAG: hypothetical protein CO029_01365 [Candidatus Magasanikbacteria bacterium CG_4_9_14_0_2_um_filter_41_10]|uniref:Uncharacterized protein n=1 Tax=Candidatus Magasanikbacteria bacterium CG_4_10_14_0_2_um_filter_41_31 TaxID=1974639 RepID=A0A2M7V5E4_9BACT|nr:MAG: hypothetical protein AUJ37_01975 [Candidatus Magasanikbacteria bacterium CG1_02_41_34]PIZ93740.1 MAG: hypothetical protein COX83_01235 [Candidatus Magasanikbacteria bacterium CG_4_10_14_0_2_um_filter_41_31]PJC53728.1 MAG: hypothetical protein CO029_01365 [Candidatus Magasanikbacteria bacterium CG_4_9_14_0_2_um_filter_41_10]